MEETNTTVDAHVTTLFTGYINDLDAVQKLMAATNGNVKKLFDVLDTFEIATFEGFIITQHRCGVIQLAANDDTQSQNGLTLSQQLAAVAQHALKCHDPSGLGSTEDSDEQAA